MPAPKPQILLLLALCLFAAAACAAAPDIVFETIVLSNATAEEIAPLLGPKFSLPGEPTAPGPRPESEAGLPRLPEGITLITAGERRSHYLLVAGTAEAIAQVRALVGQQESKPGPLRVTVTVLRTNVGALSGWEELPAFPGVEATVYRRAAGRRLNLPPMLVQPGRNQVQVDTSSEVAELMLLPSFPEWPQVLLAARPAVKEDGSVALSLGLGLFDGTRKPEDIVKQALGLPYEASVKPGEELTLLLSGAKSALMVILNARFSS